MMQSSEAVRGLTTKPVETLRYNSLSASPHESPALLISMIPEGARVLDIGCGTGSVASMIRGLRRVDIVGIEPNPERAKRAEQDGLTVINGLYTDDIPKKYGKFDVILFADVIEHFENPIAILEQIKPALSATGNVLASIPNVAHWTVRLRLLAGQFDYQPTGIMDATHLRWFTRKGVRRLFDGAGYNIEHFYSAAGAWMGAYHVIPLRLVPYKVRSHVLSKLCVVAPGLVAAQHVVSAKLK